MASNIQNGNLDYRWLTFADGKTRFYENYALFNGAYIRMEAGIIMFESANPVIGSTLFYLSSTLR